MDETGHKIKVDKNGCVVDKIGHFLNLVDTTVDTTGYTRVFSGQNRAYC